MKLLLVLIFSFYLSPSYSQTKGNNFSQRPATFLVAKNSKRSRGYLNGDVLKIHYHSNGNVIKAKGRLFLLSEDSVQLIPYGKKRIVTISVADIASIGRWRRANKISAAILGGTGLAAAGLALAMEPPHNSVARDGNFLGFTLVLYASVVLWYEIVDIPAFIISEIISTRSEKKGYHFHVETGNINTIIHRRRYF